MEALLQKKKQWEFKNHLVLERVARISRDLAIESLKAAVLLTSFLLYLIYILIRGMLVQRMIRKIGPNCRPQEFNPRGSELYLRTKMTNHIR